MIIVAGGDSFVYGSELADCVGMESASTFTALLAKHGNYICSAWPGAGNDAIARRVIDYCENLKKDQLGVVVSWTFPGRYEFKFAYNTGQQTGHWYTINAWTAVDDISIIKQEFVNDNEHIYQDHQRNIERAKTLGIADFADVFYRNVGSTEYWEVYSSLKEIVYLQNYLKLNHIPYMFTCADNSLLYNHTVANADASVKSLLNQLDMTRWFWFPPGAGANQTEQPRGFYQWAVENKYPVGTTHPLEQAHIEASKLMQEKFNEMVSKHI
jgi:hypothetical protein